MPGLPGMGTPIKPKTGCNAQHNIYNIYLRSMYYG